MIALLLGRDAEVAGWVGGRIGGPDFGPCTAIGVLSHGKLAAGVVYSNFIRYRGAPVSIEMSVAADHRRWLTRAILFSLFAYPFLDLGVPRVQSTMACDNRHAIAFNKKLGFTPEGIGRRAYFDGRDCLVTSMLKDECKWIRKE